MTATNWSNINDFEGLTSSANANAPFWSLMLMMLWAILITTFMRFGVMTAVLAGSFATLIIGIFLVYSGLVAWPYLLAIIAILVATIIYDLFFGRDD